MSAKDDNAISLSMQMNGIEIHKLYIFVLYEICFVKFEFF